MKTVRISAREVGDGQPCYVIAEAGSNHNGSLELAKRLIDVAANAHADAVKFQVFKADRLYPRNAGYEVRLVRSSHRVRVLKREELIARIHD